jgi:hypothetical protein
MSNLPHELDEDMVVDLQRYENQLLKRDELNEEIEPEDLPEEVRLLIEQYHDDDLPVLTRGQVLNIMQRLHKPGFMIRASLPLTCVGEGITKANVEVEPCPYVPGCPLVDANVAPIGHSCPFEIKTVDVLFSQYIRDLQVPPNNMVEMGQVKDLVMIDLVMQRISGTLARHGLIDINPIGAVNTYHSKFEGEPQADTEILYRKDPSAVAELLDKLTMRKHSILKSMMATREMQARYKKKDDVEDTASLIAKLKQRKTAENLTEETE